MSQSSNIAAPAASFSSAASRGAGTLGLWVMLSGTFLVVLDFFIVNVALPSMQRELRASAGTLQMVVAGYGLATAAGLITGGRLGDLFGRRRMFMLGLLLFTLASAACGLAPNAELLVAARVLQGLAGALLQPQVLAMIGLAYTGESRARAFAAYGLTLGLGATLGQLVGGLLIHADPGGLGWRSCFLINVPIGLLALVLAPRAIPPLANGGNSRLDLAGMLLVAAGSVAVVLPLVEGREQGWPLWSWMCLAASLPLLAAFAFQQRRLAANGGAPLVAPVLLANRRFVMGLFTTLAFYVGNASLYFVLALYLQQGLVLDPLSSGLVFTSLAVGFFATSMAGARLARRFGGQPPIALGALVLAVGHALQFVNVAGWAGHAHVVAWMVPLLLVQGAGLGMVMAPLVSTVLAGLPPQHAGVASGVLSMVQQASNALGVALIGILFYGRLGGAPDAAGYASAFGVALVYLMASALLVAVLQRRGSRPQPKA
ncbi:EmrB/QacA subfamily drug resistance transporter [Variovorax beijingensis]|uniref:EmrB/QacA subfamily drug resistance transporter n=1 Tax=Variovorax beijingensis TaxID=2496117 RepID=A0A561BIN3_9BURK|nr:MULTISPECIES: MFS transporter [Variovorax]MBD9662899.1 MFS transporter [Variovorax sp. VRV01]MDP9963309.1 EmrB/QacA subfamily drug resistance transporter [Variovorax paradoxus]TWD78622.1 EmrB/QacA subfamily drug resistance transporter [Variovorax beijingensis]